MLELMKIKNMMMKRKVHIQRTLSWESRERKRKANQGKTNGCGVYHGRSLTLISDEADSL